MALLGIAGVAGALLGNVGVGGEVAPLDVGELGFFATGTPTFALARDAKDGFAGAGTALEESGAVPVGGFTRTVG